MFPLPVAAYLRSTIVTTWEGSVASGALRRMPTCFYARKEAWISRTCLHSGWLGEPERNPILAVILHTDVI